MKWWGEWTESEETRERQRRDKDGTYGVKRKIWETKRCLSVGSFPLLPASGRSFGSLRSPTALPKGMDRRDRHEGGEAHVMEAKKSVNQGKKHILLSEIL